ncbi:hypothetical protein PCASD_07446 [Puccinia coronata f. sp. avenae]|uniref:Uncharacterized protein n=1 Tax=Puccinia coronata f. sp. avenae TaxID=200324 RepID=A0A2N5TG80_9BASI|nr:hypothetical protein PCASD_07446 [Puccinia coronata f. sp. avenae]
MSGSSPRGLLGDVTYSGSPRGTPASAAREPPCPIGTPISRRQHSKHNFDDEHISEQPVHHINIIILSASSNFLLIAPSSDIWAELYTQKSPKPTSTV